MANKPFDIPPHQRKSDLLGAGETTANIGSGVASVIGEKSATAVGASSEVVAGTETVTGGLKVATGLRGAWAGVRKFAGKIATPLIAVAGLFQTAKAVKKKDGHAAAKAAGGTAGSIGGMLAGDAAAGFVLGTIFPGLGNIVGAIVGGIVGIATMIFGGWFGSKVADGVAGDTLHKVLNKGTVPVKNKAVPASQNITAAEAIDESSPSFRARIMDERNKPRSGIQH